LERSKKGYSLLKNIQHIFKNRKSNITIVLAIVLYCISLVTQNYNNKKYIPENVEQQFESVINAKEKDFESLLNDDTFLKDCNTKANQISFTNLLEKQYGVFLYHIKNDSSISLKAWSNNNYHINENDIKTTDSSYIVNYENGTFEIIRHRSVKNKHLLFIATIPVRWKYFIKNKYLVSSFDNLKNYEKYFEISDKQTSIAIKSISWKVLFYLKKTQNGFFFSYNLITILLRLFSVIFLIQFIFLKCKQLINKIGFSKSFSLLVSILTIARLVSYFFSFPFNTSKLSLFDPSIYASNSIHPSLGDLIVNSVLVYLIILFFEKYHRSNANTVKRKIRIIVQTINVIAITIISLFFASILKSLVIDSKISFDVSNFFSLNIFSAAALIEIGLLFIIFYKLTSLLLNVGANKGISIANKIAAITLTSIVIAAFESLQIDYQLQPIIILTIWTIVYVLVFQKINNTDKISANGFAIPLFWIIYFTTSASALVIFNSKSLEIEQRKKIAEKIYLQTDAITENLLNIATTGFNDFFFQKNFHRFNSQKATTFIKDSLIAENFSGYLNKFETNIYLFDKDCKPIYNADSSSADRWNKSITTSGKSIGLDGLFSITNASIENSYIYKKLILDKYEQLLCQLFILLHPKKNKNKGVLPELFHQGQDEDLQYSYPFALYDSGKLKEQNGNFFFTKNQAPLQQMYSVENIDNASVLTFQPTKFNSVVVVKNNRTLLDFITLFAYLFFSFLIIIFFLYLLDFPKEKIKTHLLTLKIFKLDIRNQILATLVFSSIVSFIVIGIITILFFINKFNQSSQDRLVKSINYSAVEIENSLIKNDSLDNIKMQDLLQRLSEQQSLDLNLFDTTGALIATTQPYIYNRKLVDNKINPNAFKQIFIDKQNTFKQEEKIGLLPFLSLYKPIVSDNGNTIACINIPYLNSQAELNQEMSGFIATLMNLNAFIFLLAGAIAYLITNKITSSFKLIKEKMKAVNWQSHNDEIIWDKDDEIGALVKEYNIMVKKLDETAKAFALSQREKAWKEMAMQVAHEIKNPLTPMKLSIQYLQKNIDDNAPNIKELSKNVATTLIEQIDQLTSIASEFSQFANIGNNNLEQIDLNEVILNLVNLYAVDSKINIENKLSTQEIFIVADKIQMMRLFTNLIKNAIEASTQKDAVKIYINQDINNNAVITSIKDEGCGISEELQSKIFTLNFTTKSSGTGLGLAICKGIVENANGKIWFKTSESGTTFFVELPLIS
jgi:signal transduction histidine kinase